MRAAAGAPGWERHPERIRCKAGTPTEYGRKRTASSGATAGPAESRGGPGALKTLRSSATAALPPKQGGIKSNQGKKGSARFYEEKQHPSESHSCSPPAPDPLHGSRFWLPSRPANKHTNHNPISRPRTGPHTYEHPPAPGSSAGPRRYKASRSPTLRSRPHPPQTALPLPLTPTVPRCGRVGVAAVPKLTARAPPSSRPPTGGGDGCSSRKGTSRIKSGTSSAAEWLKRGRPQTSSASGAPWRASLAGRCAPP